MVIIEMILLPMIFLQIGLGESRGYAGKNERLGERMRGPTQYSTEDPLLGQEVESTGKVSLCQEIHPKAWAHPHPQGGSPRNHFTCKSPSYLIHKMRQVGWLEVTHAGTGSDTGHALRTYCGIVLTLSKDG